MWVDEQKRLWEDRNRDTWQVPLISSDGAYLGNVVAQVVEPSQYLVRYFLIFSHDQDRRFLLPSDAVQALGENLRSLDAEEVLRCLPSYQAQLSKKIETEIYQSIGREPYWAAL